MKITKYCLLDPEFGNSNNYDISVWKSNKLTLIEKRKIQRLIKEMCDMAICTSFLNVMTSNGEKYVKHNYLDSELNKSVEITRKEKYTKKLIENKLKE